MATNPEGLTDTAADPAAVEEKTEDQADFSSAFKERAGVEPEAPEGKQPETEVVKDAGADAPADKAPGDKPDAKPGSDKPDPWAGLNAEQRAAVERLTQSERSQRGRIAALSRKLNSTAPAPTAAPAAEAGKAEPKPSDDGNDAAATAAADLQKRLDQAVEDYPDAVGPIAEIIKEMREGMAQLASTVKPIATDMEAEQLTEAFEQLEQNHSDYVEIAQDRNFLSWVGSQPKSVQAMVNSFDPLEVSLGLTLYKAERAKATAEAGGGQEPKSNATDAKRERQLEGSRQVSSRGAPAAAGTPNDFSAAFKARAETYKK